MGWTAKDKVRAGGTVVMGLAIAFAVYADKTGADFLTDVEGSKTALVNAGYTPVKVGGYSAFGCHKGDIKGTKFTATNANNKPVNGTVCKSWFGRQTITFN